MKGVAFPLCELDATHSLRSNASLDAPVLIDPMAMPQNAARALRTGWSSADVMWRLAGDTATDYNHYTKRAILASIYGATLAIFVDDESKGKGETKAFLDRRIDGVMKFEKAKAKWLNSERESFSMSRFLGRLRYPAR